MLNEASLHGPDGYNLNVQKLKKTQVSKWEGVPELDEPGTPYPTKVEGCQLLFVIVGVVFSALIGAREGSLRSVCFLIASHICLGEPASPKRRNSGCGRRVIFQG